MSLDTRGFVDALEPIRQQAIWELDRLQTELATSLQHLQQLQAEQQALQLQVEAQSAWLQPSATKPLNPTLARQGLAYLAQAARRGDELKQAIERANTTYQDKQMQCCTQQLKLDAFERHHEEGLQAHGIQQQTKAAFVADADWVMRSQWIKRQLLADTPGSTP